MVKDLIKSTASYYLFWWIPFTLMQLLFIVMNLDMLNTVGISEILWSFYHAQPLNLSMAAYFTVLPFLLYILQSFVKANFYQPFVKVYTLLLLAIVFVATVAELEIYKEWGTKLNLKALSYLKNPAEVVRTASNRFTLVFILFVSLLTTGCYWIFTMWFLKKESNRLTNFNFKFVVLNLFSMVIGVGLLVVAIRGGLGQIPVNQSSCYYSKNHTLNLAATNSIWSLLHSYWQNRKFGSTNIYLTTSLKEAKSVVDSLQNVEMDTTTVFLNNRRPNVVFFILEGWCGDAVGACGGDSSITPFFNTLANEGLNFQHCYSSGRRSDQGMAAIFSGFPSQPVSCIIEQPDKFVKLPSINKEFARNGYYTSYYFGGELEYANIKGYMIFNKMDKIVDEANLPSGMPKGKLGVHDEYILDLFGKDLGKQKQPFFSSVFTTSTHSPYDIPREPYRHWGTEMDGYVNSMIYTDSCFKILFNQIKNEPWYKNTLFVFVADHGHNTHRWFDNYSPKFHQIPLLFYGEVIKEEFRGKNIKKIVEQTDLAKTLLAQLGMDYKPFKWSKNMMNPYSKEFAFLTGVSGSGWVCPVGSWAYDYNGKFFLWEDIKDKAYKKRILKEGKSYLQASYQEYLDY